MEALKKFGAKFSAHYEKIILSVILLALLGAAAFLPFRVSQNRDMIRQALELETRAKKKDREPLDLAPYEDVIRRETTAPRLVLSGEHNLLNPVVWKRAPNGKLIKVVRGDEDGPGGLFVSAIRPLHVTVDYDGVTTNGESLRYKFTILDESKPGHSRSSKTYSTNSPAKNDFIILTRVNGSSDNPTSIEFRFQDSTETATVTKDQVFTRIAGYEADLVHEKLGTNLKNLRAKQSQSVRLGTQNYNIVAITKDEVTVQSIASKKRWTVRRKGAS